MSLRILITGGSGLLGLNWAAARSHIDDVWLGLNNRQITLDGANTVSLTFGLDNAISSTKPDVIIHTAALTNVDFCERYEKQAFAVNCDLAQSYARIAHNRGLPFVHISTDHLFDGTHPMAAETLLCEPINSYGRSKWSGELAVLNAHPNALVLRVNFFGWGASFRPSFSDWILTGIDQASKLKLYGNVYFTPLYVGDLVMLSHQLIDKGARGVYNVASSDRLSKYDFGIKLSKAFGYPYDTILYSLYDPDQGTPRPLDMSLDNSKVLDALGIDKLSIDDAIDELVKNKHLKEKFSLIDQNFNLT